MGGRETIPAVPPQPLRCHETACRRRRRHCSSGCRTLSYFVLAVLMGECLEKHSCVSSLFHLAILNMTLFFAV